MDISEDFLTVDPEMEEQVFGDWSVSSYGNYLGLDGDPNELATIVGNNRVWTMNLEEKVRVNWVKEGF